MVGWALAVSRNQSLGGREGRERKGKKDKKSLLSHGLVEGWQACREMAGLADAQITWWRVRQVRGDMKRGVQEDEWVGKGPDAHMGRRMEADSGEGQSCEWTEGGKRSKGRGGKA
jgi:hypothetical protein